MPLPGVPVKVQITVVVTPPGQFSRVESMTLQLRDGPYAEGDLVVANAARQVARRAGLGKPTPAKEGGRG